jgi:hypothetical protein
LFKSYLKGVVEFYNRHIRNSEIGEKTQNKKRRYFEYSTAVVQFVNFTKMVYIRSMSMLSGKGDHSQAVVYTKEDQGLDVGSAQHTCDDDKVVDVESGSTGKKVQTGKQRLRFNLFFNLVLWILVPLPFW